MTPFGLQQDIAQAPRIARMKQNSIPAEWLLGNDPSCDHDKRQCQKTPDMTSEASDLNGSE